MNPRNQGNRRDRHLFLWCLLGVRLTGECTENKFCFFVFCFLTRSKAIFTWSIFNYICNNKNVIKLYYYYSPVYQFKYTNNNAAVCRLIKTADAPFTQLSMTNGQAYL